MMARHADGRRIIMRQGWRLLVLAALATFGAGCATSTPTPTPTKSGGGQAGPPVVEVLPNGLTLVVQDHRAADIVAVHLWVATGVRYETPETLGHAHFQEHMLFKGTDTFGPGHIDRTVEGTGGRSNAFTAADYTTYQVLVPSEATSTAIQLLEQSPASRPTPPGPPSCGSSTAWCSWTIRTAGPCSGRRPR
jgi:hypothetical protein